MKTAIKALLAGVGLAPARQVDRLADQARQAAARATELEERMAKLRADVESWKHRYEESASAVAEWKHAASTANAKAERAAVEAQRAETRADELKLRSEALVVQVQALRERLGKATHAATTAREHLMATEVKLDLIEAAIQVLDTRTRESVVART